MIHKNKKNTVKPDTVAPREHRGFIMQHYSAAELESALVLV